MAEKFTFNGVEMSLEDVQKKMAELKGLMSLKKEAKKAGLIVATKGAPKEKPPEVAILAANFKPAIDTNTKIIAGLFDGVYKGQDSISFNVTDRYQVIIRDRVITKQKADARAKAKPATAEPAKVASPAQASVKAK